MNNDQKSGFDSLFRGIAGILQLANDIVVKAGDGESVEVRRSTGVPGVLKTFYGGSVRVGGRVAPPRRRVTVRQNASREAFVDDTREPPVDVFDEADHYLVVAELPGVELHAIEWMVREGVRLAIRAEASDRKYFTEVDLPGLANDQAAVCRCENGVMELRLCKA